MGTSGAGDGAGEIRVLVDNGEYALRNRGDLALMAMTVERLRERWGRARIGVLTDEPHLLRALLPQAEPIAAGGGGHWGRGGFIGHLDQLAGARVTGPAVRRWRHVTDAPLDTLREVRARVRTEVRSRTGTGPEVTGMPPLPPVPAAVAESSLVIAQGGQYLADADRFQAHRTLNLLEHAQRLGIPTAMLGQGLGPMRDPELLRRAAEVLPGVDVIAVRDRLFGPKLLAELGVPADRVLVTGDDAVEFGYRLRSPEIGGELGLCATVSGAARTALDAAVRVSTLGPVRAVDNRAGTAESLARCVARCRVLVTGAFHPAVFALSQGIPAVAVTASRHYDDKFSGLADMFGTGLRVVHLDADDLESRLANAVRELWEAAPELRDTLQQRAVEQIDDARTGLERVFRLVGVRSASRSN
ncbi:polysaccharide pyruvyl transferase family protein [Nocardia sp. NPDC003693]